MLGRIAFLESNSTLTVTWCGNLLFTPLSQREYCKLLSPNRNIWRLPRLPGSRPGFAMKILTRGGNGAIPDNAFCCCCKAKHKLSRCWSMFGHQLATIRTSLPWYISISDLLGISLFYSVSDQFAEPKATALKEILMSLLGIHGMLVRWASWPLKRRQQPRNSWFFWTFISAPIEKVSSYTGYHVPEQWKFTTESLLVYIGLAYLL